MLKKVLGALWRRTPVLIRRWTVRLVEPRFTVTAGAVILDNRGRVLLLKHVFRAGAGWGIPGGFIEEGEQPESAIRRELREEAGLELEDLELAFVRTLKKPRQVEIIFRGRPANEVAPQSMEISGARWFPGDALPQGITKDQAALINRALNHGARRPG